MKLAINKCFGGFDLSDALLEELIALGVPHYTSWDDIPEGNDPYVCTPPQSEMVGFNKHSSNFRDYDKRSHPLLIQAIEKLGEEASSGRFGEIKIVEIPDDVGFEFDEYDGIETVHETHRSWG